MTNAAISSSVHVVITMLLGALVTALSCFAFYVFRTTTAREQSFTDAMKVIRAATEIVASIAERGIPGLRVRIDELESRNRVLEQYQRKTGSVIENLARTVTGGGGAPAPAPQQIPDEAAMLAARKAARAASATPSTTQ